MDVINAIAKVRFSSARPQRVQLSKCPKYTCELICLEPGQEFSAAGRCGYYVILGNGSIKGSKGSLPLSPGKFVACDEDEAHTIINSSEQRLVCLVIS